MCAYAHAEFDRCSRSLTLPRYSTAFARSSYDKRAEIKGRTLNFRRYSFVLATSLIYSILYYVTCLFTRTRARTRGSRCANNRPISYKVRPTFRLRSNILLPRDISFEPRVSSMTIIRFVRTGNISVLGGKSVTYTLSSMR